MSQLAHYMGRCLAAWWSTAIILASFLALCIPAQGAEANHSTELAEREAFIRKAMGREQKRGNRPTKTCLKAMKTCLKATKT